MTAIDYIHGQHVFSRRVRVLSQHLAHALPQGASVLDVGCGDGSIARRILDHRPDLSLEGIDVLIRPETAIPVLPFDGTTIPHPDNSFDAVMFVDVLHHTEDPMVLLKEAVRVARKGILIKDHLREGMLAGPTLRFMDWVGNARHNVVLPYNYWRERQWREAFQTLGLNVQHWQTNLNLYPAWANWCFGRKLHVVTWLEK